MMLVTLDEASDHLRRDTTDDDDDLTLKIMAASQAVQNYLKTTSPYELDSNDDVVTDSDGDPVVRFEVRAAVLMLVGELYRHRDGDGSNWGFGYLPLPVRAMLYPLRTPTMG